MFYTFLTYIFSMYCNTSFYRRMYKYGEFHECLINHDVNCKGSCQLYGSKDKRYKPTECDCKKSQAKDYYDAYYNWSVFYKMSIKTETCEDFEQSKLKLCGFCMWTSILFSKYFHEKQFNFCCIFESLSCPCGRYLTLGTIQSFAGGYI